MTVFLTPHPSRRLVRRRGPGGSFVKNRQALLGALGEMGRAFLDLIREMGPCEPTVLGRTLIF